MLIHSKGKALSLSSWRGRSSYYFTKYEWGGRGGGGEAHDQLRERIGDVSTALKASLCMGGAVGGWCGVPSLGRTAPGQPLPHVWCQQ